MDLRNKERLVVKGYSYEKDITFNEASTHILDTMNLPCVQWSLKIQDTVQRWIQGAFLNEKLQKEVYEEQPPHFAYPDFINHVLDKALYALKQTPRVYIKLKDVSLIKLFSFEKLNMNFSQFKYNLMICNIWLCY